MTVDLLFYVLKTKLVHQLILVLPKIEKAIRSLNLLQLLPLPILLPMLELKLVDFVIYYVPWIQYLIILPPPLALLAEIFC